MSHFLIHISKLSRSEGTRKDEVSRKKRGVEMEEKNREREERKDQVGRAVSKGRDIDKL